MLISKDVIKMYQKKKGMAKLIFSPPPFFLLKSPGDYSLFFMRRSLIRAFLPVRSRK